MGRVLPTRLPGASCCGSLISESAPLQPELCASPAGVASRAEPSTLDQTLAPQAPLSGGLAVACFIFLLLEDFKTKDLSSVLSV